MGTIELETAPLLLAFAAGIASFVSPCHLAVVPAFLGYLGGTAAGTTATRAVLVRRAALWALGFSLVMVALGISVGLVGYLLWDQMPILRKLGGALLLVFGLHTVGLLRLSALYREVRWSPRLPSVPGEVSALALGLVFGLGWTPCIGPVLAAILLLAAEQATVWSGAALLAVYAAGLSVPFLVTALALGRARVIVTGLRRYSRPVELATGGLLVAMGVLLYTNQFQRAAALLGTWVPL